MKKVYYLAAAALVVVGLTGCNRGWPGCFGRGLFYPGHEAYGAYYDSCDSCGSHYGDAGSEWVPVLPENAESVPTEAPAEATDSAADA